MADLPISSAATIDHTTIATGDLFPVVDISAASGSRGSKITLAELSLKILTGGSATALTGLGIRSTGAAFDLTLASAEALTAGRTLTFNVGDANRTLTIPASGTAALLGTAQTFSAANVFSINGSASTPAIKFTGAIFSGGSGSTTKPLLLMENSGATSTNWNPAGTYIGVNAPSSDNGSALFFSFQKDGGNIATLNQTGALVIPQGALTIGSIAQASNGWLQWTSRTIIYSPSDGVVKMMNNAETSFGRLCFGPATSGFTALKANTTTLQCRLADDSAYAAFDALAYKVGGVAGVSGTVTSSSTVTVVNGIITNIA